MRNSLIIIKIAILIKNVDKDRLPKSESKNLLIEGIEGGFLNLLSSWYNSRNLLLDKIVIIDAPIEINTVMIIKIQLMMMKK